MDGWNFRFETDRSNLQAIAQIFGLSKTWAAQYGMGDYTTSRPGFPSWTIAGRRLPW